MPLRGVAWRWRHAHHTGNFTPVNNKPVIDRTLRPRCCHLIRVREVVPCVRWPAIGISATLASGLDFLLAFYNDHCRKRRTVVELRW